MSFMRLTLVPLAVALAAPLPAVAQEAAGAPGVTLTFGGGARSQPTFFGSDEVEVVPDIAFSVDRFILPNGMGWGDGAASGLGFRGSFRVVPERNGSDAAFLTGFEDIDTTVELGVGVTYTTPNFEAFADVRQGIGGHESLVGEVGADLLYQPDTRTTFTFGPRVLIGSDDYADTYFGVTAADAAASTLPQYDPEGGALSAGLELGVDYDLGGDWTVYGDVRYDRYLDEAANSPIVQQDDQVTISVGVTRTVSFGF